MLSLLAEDVATIPADILERAIDRYVTSSPYMPKAADLFRIAKEMADRSNVVSIQRTGKGYAHDLAESYNARRTRHDVEWYVNEIGDVAMRDCPLWSSERTNRMAVEAERDRQQFKHRTEYPINGREEVR